MTQGPTSTRRKHKTKQDDFQVGQRLPTRWTNNTCSDYWNWICCLEAASFALWQNLLLSISNNVISQGSLGMGWKNTLFLHHTALILYLASGKGVIFKVKKSNIIIENQKEKKHLQLGQKISPFFMAVFLEVKSNYSYIYKFIQSRRWRSVVHHI